MFLNISCAPKATATEKRPKPAIIGPISIPQISNIMVIATTQIKTPATLLSQVLIAGVSQELSPSIVKRGLVKLEKALKIVYITTIFTKLVATKSREPEKGR